jgi:hypothetical protein
MTTKKIDGKVFRLRPNTDGSTRAELVKLAKYGIQKGHIKNYRIIKEDGRLRLYIH